MKSATAIGRGLGLGAQEVNFALAEAGLQERKFGAWALTELGKKYAADEWHHRGPGGSPAYNRDWDTRRWKETVTDLLGELTPDRKRHLRETVKAARRASRAAPAEVAPSIARTVASTQGAGSLALRNASAVRAAVAGAALYGLYQAGSIISSRRRAAKAASNHDSVGADPQAEPRGGAGPEDAE